MTTTHSLPCNDQEGMEVSPFPAGLTYHTWLLSTQMAQSESL
jgi:hypothetical protein